MNVQRLIDQLDEEIELLRSDLSNVNNDITARAIHDAINNRENTIIDLKIKYPQYIKQ